MVNYKYSKGLSLKHIHLIFIAIFSLILAIASPLFVFWFSESKSFAEGDSPGALRTSALAGVLGTATFLSYLQTRRGNDLQQTKFETEKEFNEISTLKERFHNIVEKIDNTTDSAGVKSILLLSNLADEWIALGKEKLLLNNEKENQNSKIIKIYEKEVQTIIDSLCSIAIDTENFSPRVLNTVISTIESRINQSEFSWDCYNFNFRNLKASSDIKIKISNKFHGSFNFQNCTFNSCAVHFEIIDVKQINIDFSESHFLNTDFRLLAKKVSHNINFNFKDAKIKKSNFHLRCDLRENDRVSFYKAEFTERSALELNKVNLLSGSDFSVSEACFDSSSLKIINSVIVDSYFKIAKSKFLNKSNIVISSSKFSGDRKFNNVTVGKSKFLMQNTTLHDTNFRFIDCDLRNPNFIILDVFLDNSSLDFSRSSFSKQGNYKIESIKISSLLEKASIRGLKDGWEVAKISYVE